MGSYMPRKPTKYSSSAEKNIRDLAAKSDGDMPLPSVRELALTFDISFATVSRILQRLSQEAIVWQHPNRRFYPSSAQPRVSGGFPIVVLGRQIQNWSILYREIIEGISEICTARGCPLVFLSSLRLLQHETPDYPPAFIPASRQKAELTRLLASIPRPCGGVILDHLWDDKLATTVRASFRNTAMLLRPCSGLNDLRGSIDQATGVEMMLTLLGKQDYRRFIVAYPFAGDQAVEASLSILESAIKERGLSRLQHADCTTPESRRRFAISLRRSKERVAVISLEDHVAALLLEELAKAHVSCPARVGLVSLQGTSAVGSSVTRLRYDYRLLGRELVSALLANNQSWRPLRPTLIRGRTASAD